MTPGEFMRAYEAATQSHDCSAVLDLVAEDAIFFFSNRASLIGKEAIGKAIQTNFDTIEDERYRIADLRWLAVSEEVAACVYHFQWSGVIGGKPASGEGRGTSVIRRIDGAWKVAHEHLSAGGLGKE